MPKTSPRAPKPASSRKAPGSKTKRAIRAGTSPKVRRVDATVARDTFVDTIDTVRVDQRRIIVSRRGQDLAAIVPLSDLAELERLESLEDADDVRVVRRRLAKAKARKERPIPIEEARRRLGV